MKKLAYTITLVSSVLLLGSCKKYLDVNKNPNAAENIDPKLLFSFAVTSMANERAGGDCHLPLALAGQTMSDGGNNPTAWGAPSAQEYNLSPFNYRNMWSTYYGSVGANLKQVIAISEAATPKNNNAAAQSKVMLAQTVYDLTMLFGDVPFSEAWRSDISYPHFDPQQQVLNGIVTLLDEAYAQFDEASVLKISDYDLIYKGDIAKWKRAARSLKLKVLMTMVDKDPSKTAAIGQLVTGGGLIASAGDNFAFPFYNTSGRENPKYGLIKQYGIYPDESYFFATTYVADFMRPLNDPRLPVYFRKPAAATNYYGVQPGDDGDDNIHSRIHMYNPANGARGLQNPDSPEMLYSYQEELFYEAEVYARGLGVPVNLATANTLYKKAVEESVKYYLTQAGTSLSAATTTATAFSATLPDLSTVASPVKLIHYHHWVDEMDRGLDAFTEWRRSGPEGNETPALTLPIGAPAGGLFRRYEYPVDVELSSNPNALANIRYNVKMWFDL